MNKKMRARKRRQARRVALTLVLMLTVALVSIGGTLAWLTAKTDSVVNTFTTAGIDITLTETPNQIDNTWKAQLIPGKEYAKDPVVSVVREDAEGNPVTDVDVYLYVKVEDNDPDEYLQYTSNLNNKNGWTLVTDTTNVWWREVAEDDEEVSWHLIAGDKVTINSEIEKDETDVSFTLKYTAYAIQTEGFADADAAWVEVSKLG